MRACSCKRLNLSDDCTVLVNADWGSSQGKQDGQQIVEHLLTLFSAAGYPRIKCTGTVSCDPDIPDRSGVPVIPVRAGVGVDVIMDVAPSFGMAKKVDLYQQTVEYLKTQNYEFTQPDDEVA